MSDFVEARLLKTEPPSVGAVLPGTSANGTQPAPRLKLNLGCGHVQPAGWGNVDDSYRAWLASRLPFLDRLLVRLRLLPITEFNRHVCYFNLERHFPWRDGSVHAIYLGEILEHFTPAMGQRVMRECFRI